MDGLNCFCDFYLILLEHAFLTGVIPPRGQNWVLVDEKNLRYINDL